jgi:hypothetical protein
LCMTTSKSPRKVAAAALAVGTDAFRAYSHKFSPKKFTQPQLFACLVLKAFHKSDYRGIQAILLDHSDLRNDLGLKLVPHYTTLQKASDRLLRLPKARRVLAATLRLTLGRARRGRRRRFRVARAAMDSSGLDCGHASSYYVQRRAKGQNRSETPAQKTTYQHYAKLEAVFDCRSHLILAAAGGLGPKPDTPRFVPLLEGALDQVRLGTILADAGYDSEPNHCHARQSRGVRSLIPATTGRPSPKPPRGRWRRRMKQRLATKRLRRRWGYGQRWQAECGFSMIKRRLAVHVAAHSYWRQVRELWGLVLTHNTMILLAIRVFYRAGMSRFFSRSAKLTGKRRACR